MGANKCSKAKRARASPTYTLKLIGRNSGRKVLAYESKSINVSRFALKDSGVPGREIAENIIFKKP